MICCLSAATQCVSVCAGGRGGAQGLIFNLNGHKLCCEQHWTRCRVTADQYHNTDVLKINRLLVFRFRCCCFFNQNSFLHDLLCRLNIPPDYLSIQIQIKEIYSQYLVLSNMGGSSLQSLSGLLIPKILSGYFTKFGITETSITGQEIQNN